MPGGERERGKKVMLPSTVAATAHFFSFFSRKSETKGLKSSNSSTTMVPTLSPHAAAAVPPRMSSPAFRIRISAIAPRQAPRQGTPTLIAPIAAAATAAAATSTAPSSNDNSKTALIDLTRKVASLGRSGKAELALREVADAVQARQVMPDSRLATALIDACGRSSRFDLALAAFDALFGPGAPEGVGAPGEGAMDALLRAALEGGGGGGGGGGGSGGGGDGGGAEMPSTSNSASSSPSSSPKRWRDAAVALDRCAAAGLEPAVGAFNVLLACASRSRDVERGFEILKKMKSSGVEPDSGTVAAVKGRRALRSFLKKTFEV